MSSQTIGPLPLSDIKKIAGLILKMDMPRIVSIIGDLGAGKTTLVKELMHQLGATGQINSPTFGIINEYQTADNRKVCHTDWYRIKNMAELLDTGIEEYLIDENCLVLIEWPQVGEDLLRGEEVLTVNIEHSGSERIYHLELRRR
jgi:tRNA threonylcarbamoyladenosine biosynthesis protein TsaE